MLTLHALHLGPDTPAWLAAAIWPILMVHIGGGIAGLASGFTAILARKGSRLHRTAGNLFFASMLVMLSMGGLIATLEPGNQGTAVGALFGLYLVTTAWATARRPDGPAGGVEKAGFWVVLIAGATMTALSLAGLASPHAPQPQTTAGFIMGLVALLAAATDFKVVRKGIAGADRIARHLWRMCTALFFASGSFFLGQQKVMPEAVKGSPVLIVLAVAPLVLMVFWLFYVRVSKRFGGRPTAPPRAVQPAGL